MQLFLAQSVYLELSLMFNFKMDIYKMLFLVSIVKYWNWTKLCNKI
jgi:hypothetical protein